MAWIKSGLFIKKGVLKIQLPGNFEIAEDQYFFLEELQAARNFSKVTLDFNKMPNTLRQVFYTYSETCIFCVLQKNSPRKAVGED